MAKKQPPDKVGTEVFSLVVQLEWQPRSPKQTELDLPQRPSRIMLSKEGKPFKRVDRKGNRVGGEHAADITSGKDWGVALVVWRD